MPKPEYNPHTGKFETDGEERILYPSEKHNQVRIAVAGLIGLTLYQKQQLARACEDLDQLNAKLENGEVPGLGSNDPSAGGDMGGGADTSGGADMSGGDCGGGAVGGFEGFGFFG